MELPIDPHSEGTRKGEALVAAVHKLLILLNALRRDQTLWRMLPQTLPGT